MIRKPGRRSVGESGMKGMGSNYEPSEAFIQCSGDSPRETTRRVVILEWGDPSPCTTESNERKNHITSTSTTGNWQLTNGNLQLTTG
jgi:hypothetical protein